MTNAPFEINGKSFTRTSDAANHLGGLIAGINSQLNDERDPTAMAKLLDERLVLQRAQSQLVEPMCAATGTETPEQTAPAGDGPDDVPGVTDASCYASLRGNDGTSGAHFGWRCKLTDGATRQRELGVEVHVVPAEDVLENEREGLFAYWKQIDMGNGYFAVCSLRFDGEIENTEHPNVNDRELMRPFKTALHDFLEKRDDVGYLEMATFVNGGARFEFQVVGAPDGYSPGLRLTLERGDN